MLPGMAVSFPSIGVRRLVSLLLTLAVLLAVFRVGAEEAVFERLTVVDGLPDSAVEAVVQDRHGYVWIGTQGGLIRHEGVALNVLRHDPEDPASLPANNILSLMAAADGALWAAVSGAGIVRIEGTEVVRRWAPASSGGELEGNYVWAMAEACDGQVWGVYATDGVVRIDPATGASRHFPAGSAGLPDAGFGVALKRDADCRLWLLRTDGLYRIDSLGEDAEFVRVLNADPEHVRLFLDFDLDSAGGAWIGGAHGVIRVRLPDSVATRDDQAVTERHWPSDFVVSVVRHQRADSIWLGTAQGVYRLNPAADRLTVIQDVYAEPTATGGQVNDILVGSDGGLWFATPGGVARLNPGWQGFRIQRPADDAAHRSIGALAVHGDSMWVGVNKRGVLRVEVERGRFEPLEPPMIGGDQAVLGLHVDDQALWAMNRTRLVRREHTSGIEQVVIDVPEADGDRLAFLADAGEGMLWVGFDGGRLVRMLADGRIEAEWHAGASGTQMLDVPEVQSIVCGPDGHWWLLGLERVLRQDDSGRFVTVHRSPTALSALAWDGDRLWLAADSLLERLRLDGEALVSEARYTVGDGLPPGRIQALVPRDGALWLTLSIGLARLDPASGGFRLVSVGRARGLEFQPGAVANLDGGGFAAGSDQGLVLVEPDRIMPRLDPPPVYITALRAGELEFELGPTGRRSLPPLGWRRNSLEFTFRALAYLDPARNRYRARLIGWDRDWVELGTQSRHRYANLPAGDYRFEVQAAGIEGVWNRVGDALELSIDPPPWRSGAALALYAAVAMVLALVGWRSIAARRARNQAMRAARARRELAERASEAKSEFLATMSHEIRTPLHGLMGMMELLERGERDPARIEQFATMRGSGRQLQRILDDILDLSRIEAGHTDLEPHAFELPALLEQVVDLHASNAHAKGLALRLRIAHDLPAAIVGDPDRLAQVLGNLLNNAIKFTHHGAVELQAEFDGAGRLLLAVVDTGPGIAPEVERELFEPFAQLDAGATRRHSGTGLGLAICRRLIEAMDGDIGVRSLPGRGSRFEVRLPAAGMTRQAPRHSALLEELVLDARLSAPERRVLARLARRWSLPLLRPGAPLPEGCERVRVFDPWLRSGPDVDPAADVAIALVRSDRGPAPEGTFALRAPLTEARLIGALFDLALSRRLSNGAD